MPHNDGEVRVEITGDSSQIKKELKETESAVKNTTNAASEMVDALESTVSSSGGLNNIAENADSAAKSISKAANETDSLGDSIKDEAKAAEKAGNAHGNTLNPEIEETGKEAEKSGEKVSGLGKKLEAVAGIAKVGAAAIGAAAAGISAITKAAVENYGEYEQLVGGVETLFKDSADVVQEYAANAYKTAGLSANEYMETVTSFSASLLQSLGDDTDAAARAANKAITDMADNANKMGTDMQSIQNAYQGFAKANYTMLDNLKLGYGGTKEEMQRLLEDAEKFSSIKYDISSYADIVEAIHVIQEEMGITGTTAKEAASTIQGSLSSVKAAWQNLLTGIADENADFDRLINNFADSAATAVDNLLPRVKTALEGVGKLVTELSPVIAEAIPELVDDVLPSIVQAAVDLVTALVNSLVDNGGVIVDTTLDILDMLVDTLIENAYKIADGAVSIIKSLVDGLSDRLPDLIPAVVEIIAEIAKGLTDNTAELLVAALKLIQALADGLVKAIHELFESCNEICESIVDSFVNYDWDTLGHDIIANIAQGMINAKKLFDDAVNTVIKAGANTLAGFSNGVSSGGAEHGGRGKRGTRAILDNEDVETAKEAGETYADYMQRIGKQRLKESQEINEQDLKDYEENLKAKVTELDRSLTLREISEEKYYEELGKYIKENQNLESDEYYKQLDKYNKYLDKKQDAADKAAEKQLKAEKSAAEKLQKEAETAAKKAQQEAEKLLSEQEKTVEKSLSNIIKQFQKAYDEVEKKRENYKKKLLSIGGDIFSVEEITNPDGSKTKQKTVNNIDEQIKKMQEYHSEIKKLKESGTSNALLLELTSMGNEDSQDFAKYLSEMSEEELAKINELYAEKQRVAEELSKELYADEYSAIADGINTALDEVSAGAADKGKEAAESYAKAFSDTLLKHSEDFSSLLDDKTYTKWFGNSGDTPGLFAGMSGDMEKLMKMFMGSNFADIVAKVTSTVRSEQARYSAPAYTAAVGSVVPVTASSTENSRKSDITAILEKLNKPISVVLDGKVIAETVMTYQGNYQRRTGG